MKRILLSLSIIGIVSAVVIGATMAYFGDVETSTGNTMTAGSIDLKIDLQCGENCSYSLRDWPGQPFFYNPMDCDIKPGDSGEVTISWHVYDNEAWARIRTADLINYENSCTNPEIKAGDQNCGDPGEQEGELGDYLVFTLWMDEGTTTGWQCPDNGPCDQDPQEGDNKLNGIEEIFATSTANGLQEGVKLPLKLQPSTTYYLGMKWELPAETGNIVQGDSLVGKIIMEVVQSRNNPNPWE